jgi:hypothetical protein
MGLTVERYLERMRKVAEELHRRDPQLADRVLCRLEAISEAATQLAECREALDACNAPPPPLD